MRGKIAPVTGFERKALMLGAVAGPFFCALVVGQALTRKGFKLTHHPLSLLAVGEGGWVQTANFVFGGLAVAAAGLGLSRRAERPFLAWLLAIYGLGMIVAAAFPSPPSMNFPPGSVTPTTMSTSAQLHGLGFAMAQISILGAMLVMAVAYRRTDKGWSLLSLTAATISPVLIASGFASEAWRGLFFFSTVVVTLGWLTLLCLRYLVPDQISGR